MREQWARNIALLTGLLVVLLAMMFAMIQNPSEPPRSKVGKAAGKPPAFSQAGAETQVLIAAGRKVFEVQRCARCHSIAGEGNPRNPLDGVGERRSSEVIRQWVVGSAELKDQLPASIFQVKQSYQILPPEDLDALIAYLQSLKSNTATQ